MNTEHCVCCWAVIPEGRQVCPTCENGKRNGMQRKRDFEDSDTVQFVDADGTVYLNHYANVVLERIPQRAG